MGKIYCTECGAELEDTVKFCSSCGKVIDNNTPHNQSVSNNVDNASIMERIEIVPLLIGILFCVCCQVIAFMLPYKSQAIVIFIGFFVGSFLMGYLSNESYVFVLGYAVFTAIISFLVYWIFLSNRFFYLIDLLLPLFFTIVFSFIGNLVKVKLKH